jgi:uncharacterized protein YfbU (UPF0304 family)
MDKMIWKVLTEEQGCKLSGEDCTHRKCRRYLTCKGMVTAILKLFKERIGEDKNFNSEVCMWRDDADMVKEVRGFCKGYNQAKAELRNAINTEGE